MIINTIKERKKARIKNMLYCIKYDMSKGNKSPFTDEDGTTKWIDVNDLVEEIVDLICEL